MLDQRDSLPTLGETYFLAFFSLPVLGVYAVAQGALAWFIAPRQPGLKLVIEPYLLLLGLILHVQWRKASGSFAALGHRRPWWVAAGDCLSFVITFWALAVLLGALVR